MPRFLIDEDMPRSLAGALRAAGIHAEDVRDVGLRARPDNDIFAYAIGHGLALLSADLGFANILRFPLGGHEGIVVARFPNEIPTSQLNEAILRALQNLADEEIKGNLIIIEPGRIRLRRQI